MAYAIATVTGSTADPCHKKMLGIIKSLAESNGWTTLRYNTALPKHELLLKGVGLSGNEEIYIGFQTYEDVAADYYNINVMTAVGYLPNNTFETQPGAQFHSLCAHNNAITYYLIINPQRIAGCFKVGTPVYHHFYVGKFFPYARPGEFPLPILCGAMNSLNSTNRFSAVAIFPYYGRMAASAFSNTQVRVRDPSGNWAQPAAHPFSHNGSTTNALASSATAATEACLVPAAAYYQLEPIILSEYRSANTPTPVNVWGELDGIFYCSGFSNATENVVQLGGSSEIDQTGMTPLQAVDAIRAVGGTPYVMLQSTVNNAWRDFIAMEIK